MVVLSTATTARASRRFSTIALDGAHWIARLLQIRGTPVETVVAARSPGRAAGVPRTTRTIASRRWPGRRYYTVRTANGDGEKWRRRVELAWIRNWKPLRGGGPPTTLPFSVIAGERGGGRRSNGYQRKKKARNRVRKRGPALVLRAGPAVGIHFLPHHAASGPRTYLSVGPRRGAVTRACRTSAEDYSVRLKINTIL